MWDIWVPERSERAPGAPDIEKPQDFIGFLKLYSPISAPKRIQRGAMWDIWVPERSKRAPGAPDIEKPKDFLCFS